MIPGTVDAGVTTTARSAGSGMDADIRIGMNSQHARPVRIDRKYGPAERSTDEILQYGAAHAARSLARSDNSHRGR